MRIEHGTLNFFYADIYICIRKCNICLKLSIQILAVKNEIELERNMLCSFIMLIL